jgi:hypothetical protein
VNFFSGELSLEKEEWRTAERLRCVFYILKNEQREER